MEVHIDRVNYSPSYDCQRRDQGTQNTRINVRMPEGEEGCNENE